jgi:tetratricopeptide (TPR) repeat protein
MGGREGALAIAILVGTGVILLHSFIDWDFKFFAIPILLAIAGGSAVGVKRGVEDGDSTQTAWPGTRVPTLRGAIVALVVCAMVAAAGLALSADLLAASARRRDDSTGLARLTVASRLNRLDAALPFQHAGAMIQQASLFGGTGSTPLDADIMALYERSASLDPENASRLIEYARFLVLRSNPKAVDVYKTLTALDPADPGTWTGLAFAYHTTYRNDTLARQALDRAYSLDPVYGEALIVDGRIAEDAGAYDLARGFYQKAVDGEGATRTAFLVLAQLEEKHGDIPAAVRTLARAHGTFPADIQVTAELGRLGPVVTVTQPSVGTPVLRGSRVSVAWLVTGRDTAEYYDVLLAPEAGSWSILERDLGASSRSYVWIVPDDIPDGTYRIVVAARAPSLMTGAEGDGLGNGASPPVRVGG